MAALILRRVLDLVWWLLFAGAVVAMLVLIVGLLHPGRARIAMPAFLTVDFAELLRAAVLFASSWWARGHLIRPGCGFARCSWSRSRSSC